MKRFNYGEIWLADLSPSNGTEPGKTRPVLIIQNQYLLDAKHLSTLIVPLTTNLIQDAKPLRIRLSIQGQDVFTHKSINKLEQDSDLLIDQIRAVDNKRLIKGPLAKCSDVFMIEVHNAILEVIGID